MTSLRSALTTVALVCAAAVPAAAPAAAAPAPMATAASSTHGGFHALPPHRILDTRTGLGAPAARVSTGSTVTVQVSGHAGVPSSGVAAVALTVTVLSPTAAGWVTAYPHASPAPTASNLNFTAGATVPNLVLVGVSPEGAVDLRLSGQPGTTDLLVDVAGYVDDGGADGDPSSVQALSPSRVLDTRSGLGAPVGAVADGSTVHLALAGHGGIPSSGAGAALLTVTATGSRAAGYVTVAPAVTGPAATSSLNYTASETRANLVLVPLSPQGSVDLRVSGGATHLLADVAGFVTAGTPVADGGLAAVAPTRVLDTRTTKPLVNGGSVTVHVAGLGEVPSAGVGAVLVNLTATGAVTTGTVSARAAVAVGAPEAQLAVAPGRSVANLVAVPVSASGDIVVSASLTGGTVQVVADVVGYALGPPADTTAPGPVTGLTVTRTGQRAINLSWTNPPDADLAGIVVRRLPGTVAPASPIAGDLVTATSGTSVVDDGLTPGTSYSYAVFTRDDVPNYSPGRVGTATTTGLAWGAPTSVAPYVGAPSAVSCPSTSWCMAADWSGQVLTYNGSAWGHPVQVTPPSPRDELGGIPGLSCASTTFCVAAAGGLSTWSGGTWSAPVKPGGTGFGVVDCVSASFCGAVNGAGAVTLYRSGVWSTPVTPRSGVGWWSLSCRSSTFCMTVGQDTNGAGWAARWNGSSWSVTKIEPAGYSTYAVSCPTTTFCMVTDGWGKYVRYTSAGWGKPAELDVTGGFQGRYLSCTSTSFCVTFDPGRGVRRWNGSSWSAVHAVDSISSLNAALDCASSTMCVIVEQSGRYARLSDTTWQGARNFDPTTGGVRDLSCASATSCVVTDQRRGAQRFDGSSWSAPTLIASYASDVDCPTTTWCLTMDPQGASMRSYNPGTGVWGPTAPSPQNVGVPSCADPTWCFAFDDTGRAVWGNGRAWGSLKPVVYRPNASFPSTVTCTSRTFCLAISSWGDWSRWNGSSWSAPQRLPGSQADWTAVISCAGATMCLAVGQGTTWRYDGRAWAVVNAATPVRVDRVMAVSCPATNYCAALTMEGDVLTFNGSGWNPASVSSGLTFDDRPTALECPVVYTCVAAGIERVVVSSAATP